MRRLFAFFPAGAGRLLGAWLCAALALCVASCGVVGAARKGDDVNSANCQFYVTLQRTPQWDAQYTVFGKVIEGLGNAQIIAGAPTRPGTEHPADKITIKSVTLQPRANFVR